MEMFFSKNPGIVKNWILFLVCFFSIAPTVQGGEMIKTPNASGTFYFSNPLKLSQHIDFMMSQADIEPLDAHVAAVIVPHAGYVYSGGVAAYAYKAASKNKYKTIIILGPTHYYQFEGVSVWPKGGFQTPFGVAEVDERFASALMSFSNHIQYEPRIFERDHVVEVEIPFLQKTFSGFKIVPMIMSRTVDRQTVEDVAEAIYKAAGDRDDVLLVISSDMSHYHDDAYARNVDGLAMDAVQARDVDRIWTEQEARRMEIDGFKEVITALLYARKRGLNNVKVLKYANSGDVTGDKSSVVGYMAVGMY